jgi:hypothetical protein
MAVKSGERRDGTLWEFALGEFSLGKFVLAMMLCGLFVPAIGAAQVIPKNATGDQKSAPSDNPYNDQLVRLKPEQRAAKLAEFVGGSCIGTKPFLMGITKEGKAKGYAYWSLECAGGQSYMIQVAPDGEAAAMDCQTLKANGEGRECYKTF